MTMDTDSAVARRLVQLVEHLGLAQVHIAARVTADWHGLLRTQPERMASLMLVCPTGLEAGPLRSLATRLLLLTGDQGAPAEAVHKARADLPEATLATLHNYFAHPRADILHHLIEAPDDVEKVVPAIEAAYARSMPVVMLIGREPL